MSAASAQIALAGTTCLGGWQAMPTEPALQTGGPHGSSAVAGAPAWIVGRKSSVATIGSWDGTTWRNVTAPWTTDTGLNGVSSPSTTAAWAVGYQRLYLPLPVATRWDGTSWQALKMPNLGGRQSSLTGVAAASLNNAFAVGVRSYAGRYQPVVARHTASGWSKVAPSFPGEEGALTAVTRTPEGATWAVGWKTTLGVAGPWIGYWNGSGWTATDPTGLDAGLTYLTDISFRSSTEGYAVGYIELATGGYEPLLLRWDGLGWLPQSLPWTAADSVVLTTVAVDGTGLLVVGGQRVIDEAPSAMLATFDGVEWQATPPHADPYPGSYTLDATGLAEGVFVIGYFAGSTQPIITCQETPPPPPPSSRPTGPTNNPAGFADDAYSPTADSSGSGPRPAAPVPLPGYHAVNVSGSSGLAMKSLTWGGLVADLNGDGWSDVFINPHTSDTPTLKMGGPTGFTVAATNFELTDRYLCAAAESTGDAFPDLFCTVGRHQGTGMGSHEFMVNVADGGGTLEAQQYGVMDITGRGRAAAFLHMPNDTFPALFVADWPFRIDGLPSNNRLYRNPDGTHFVPAPEMGLDSSVGGTCAKAADINLDTFDELLVCSVEPGGGLANGVRLYTFDGTAFVDTTATSGLRPMQDIDIEVADFNGDTFPDIAQLNPVRLRVSLGDGTGHFTQSYSLATKTAVAIAVGDVNEDGRADIYMSRRANANTGHLMLVNGGDGTSFTSVQIPQPGRGIAEDVLAIDYDHNGLTDFITLNGNEVVGPVRLTAFFPE